MPGSRQEAHGTCNWWLTHLKAPSLPAYSLVLALAPLRPHRKQTKRPELDTLSLSYTTHHTVLRRIAK
jgi:hypothetical protein